MCAEKPRRLVPRQEHVMAVWRGQEAVGECGRVRVVSLVCLVMMSLTRHILLLRPLLVSVNISVLGVVCFQSREAIVHRMCLRDNSVETTRRFAMAAMGSFHDEVVMS